MGGIVGLESAYQQAILNLLYSPEFLGSLFEDEFNEELADIRGDVERRRSYLQSRPILKLEMETGDVPAILEIEFGGNREKERNMKMENGNWTCLDTV